MKVVIKHLEPELYKWCEVEYSTISKIIGKENLIFTNTNSDVLRELGTVEKKSVSELKLENACILDPEAAETLTPLIAKKFKYFIFGGILGDFPPKARTKELTKKMMYPAFNLGKEQMSTDTAVQVVKLIYEGKKLEEMKFATGIEIEVEEGLSVNLPYKYLIIDKQVQIDPRIIELAKEEN